MKAALCQRYGTPDVVRVGDTPTPRPGGDQILVRVHAAVVSSADVVARRGIPRYTRAVFGLRRPRRPVLGSDLVRRLGADTVVDHTAADFTRSGEKYDVVRSAFAPLQTAVTRAPTCRAYCCSVDHRG